MKKVKYRVLVRGNSSNISTYIVQRKYRWIPNKWKTVDMDHSLTRIFTKLGEVLAGNENYYTDKNHSSFLNNMTKSKINCKGKLIATIFN